LESRLAIKNARRVPTKIEPAIAEGLLAQMIVVLQIALPTAKNIINKLKIVFFILHPPFINLLPTLKIELLASRNYIMKLPVD